MKKIMQDRFYAPEINGKGNCLQAAVASILDLELCEVPNFNQVEQCFWPSFDDFLVSRGFITHRFEKHIELECFYIAHGESNRGVMHSVVYRDGKLAHDPHYSGEGIKDVKYMHVLIPLDPSKHKEDLT